MAYLDHYLMVHNARKGRGKPAKTAYLIQGDRRKHLINRVMDTMRDWRLSPFENQGSVQAGLRSALCFEGHGWGRSDKEASLLVAECLRLMGAEYPTWDQGQPEYTVPLEQCAKCGGDMPEEAREGLRRFRFCSTECARAAITSSGFASGRRADRVAWSAYRMVLKTRTSPRQCAACEKPFHTVTEQSDARYCSKKCFNVGRLKRASIPCAGCNQPFQPSRDTSKYCSFQCTKANRANRVYEVQCTCCGTDFTASSEKAKFCGSKCKNKIKYLRERRPAATPPSNVIYLTAEIFDGWFRRAA